MHGAHLWLFDVQALRERRAVRRETHIHCASETHFVMYVLLLYITQRVTGILINLVTITRRAVSATPLLHLHYVMAVHNKIPLQPHPFRTMARQDGGGGVHVAPLGEWGKR